MSNQVNAGPNDSYYLSSRGVNSIAFNKLSSPPQAYFNKGIMYELVLQIITYPHTHRDGTNIAVGVFHEITDNCNSQYDLREHKKIMNSNLDS